MAESGIALGSACAASPFVLTRPAMGGKVFYFWAGTSIKFYYVTQNLQNRTREIPGHTRQEKLTTQPKPQTRPNPLKIEQEIERGKCPLTVWLYHCPFFPHLPPPRGPGQFLGSHQFM